MVVSIELMIEPLPQSALEAYSSNSNYHLEVGIIVLTRDQRSIRGASYRAEAVDARTNDSLRTSRMNHWNTMLVDHTSLESALMLSLIHCDTRSAAFQIDHNALCSSSLPMVPPCGRQLWAFAASHCFSRPAPRHLCLPCSDFLLAEPS